MWAYNGGNKQGFTLIEMLFSLLIFSLVMTSLNSSLLNYQHLENKIQTDKQLDWLQFLTVLEQELSNYTIEVVESDVIRLREMEDTGRMYQMIQKNDKIYKTPGHHPYLYEVDDWNLTLNGHVLYVSVSFTNQQVFHGQIVVNSYVRGPT